MCLEQFVEQVYLLHVARQLRPSTFKGYADLWHNHLKGRAGIFRIREFRTSDGERLMCEIARTTDLNRTSLKHLKSMLSGVFTHAKRVGILDGVNPMQGVSIPKAKEAGETYAYSLEEVARMLQVLPELAATVVATAAFTGMRKGELRGFSWENYGEHEISVTQSIWKTHVSQPKTRSSRAPVPVIALLAKLLERHRQVMGNPASGLVFASGDGHAFNLDNLARRTIQPKLESVGLLWHGWHAFRRGLATNLYRLGVKDKDIQAILRHANVSTTLNIYVKSVSSDATAAMNALELVCSNCAVNSKSLSEVVVN
jgi:integrase